MILDVTAGNRHIWGGWMPPVDREDTIIYCDVEASLRIPADVICDNTRLPFCEKVANTVIYDPPSQSFGTSYLHGDPKEKNRGSPNGGSWWGNFVNLGKLFRLLAGGVREIDRVLKDDGIVHFKWSGAQVPLWRVLPFFTWKFIEVGRMERSSKSGRNKSTSYWVSFRRR